ncbi:MAG: hypothetical protein ACI4SB_08960, partial [Acutalibacteraceae bacterium]
EGKMSRSDRGVSTDRRHAINNNLPQSYKAAGCGEAAHLPFRRNGKDKTVGFVGRRPAVG